MRERERERESTTNGMEERDPIIEKELQETLLFIRAWNSCPIKEITNLYIISSLQ